MESKPKEQPERAHVSVQSDEQLVTPHQTISSLQREDSVTESHHWSKCRERLIVGAQPQVRHVQLHGRLRGHPGRGGGKSKGVVEPGSPG